MLKRNILEDIERAKATKQILPEGGYVCQIVDVDEENGYICIFLDISEGKYKNYFDSVGSYFYEYVWGEIYSYPTLCYDLNGNDFSEHIKFADFITIAEKSNPGFKFNGDNLNEIETIGVELKYGETCHGMMFEIASIETPAYIRNHYNMEGEN